MHALFRRNPDWFLLKSLFVSRNQHNRFATIRSMILQIVDVSDIGRYDVGSSFGLAGLSTGMIKACFHSAGSTLVVHVMFSIRKQ